jgi:hypothetical protein
MKRLWILLFALALQGPAVGELSAATLAYGEDWSGAPTQYLFEGGSCVISPFSLIALDLTEPVKAVEFSMSLPPGVDLACAYGSPGELSREGDNFYITFDECLQAADSVTLFIFYPVYEPVVVGQSCLGPAVPSQLGLTEAGYLSCDGEAVAFKTWANPNSSIPAGCATMVLEQGGPASEGHWGALKSWF